MKQAMGAKRIFAVSVLYLLSGSIVWGGSREAKQDIWLVMLLHMAVFSLIVWFYGILCRRHPGKDLFVLMEEHLPRPLFHILTVLYCGYAVLIGAMSFRSFGSFSSLLILPEMSAVTVILLLAAVCVYGAVKGVKSVSLYASFVFPFVAVILAVTMALSVKGMDLMELLPVCYDMERFLNGALTMSAFPFGDVVLLFAVYSGVKAWDDGNRHVWAVVTAFGILLVIMVRNVALLGVPLLDEIDYATYHAMGVIGIEDFFKRIEVLLTFAVVFCDVVKGSVAVIFVCQGVRRFLPQTKTVYLAAPTAAVMAVLALTLFDNTADVDAFLHRFRYVSLPLQMLAPGVTWIGALLQKKRNG